MGNVGGILLVGVVRHMWVFLKKDHILRGDILSQLFQQTRVMDALLFDELRKLLLCGPSSFSL